MKILQRIDKIPGGIVLVPMAITAVIHSFAPEALNIGGITTALFSASSTTCFIGLLLFLSGSQLKIKDVPAMLRRGGILTIAKIAIAVSLTLAFSALFPTQHIFGVSILAFCVVACSINPGPFLAVASEYGDDVDVAGFALYNLIVVPALPALILGFTSGANMDWTGMITTLIPFFLGFLIGNLDTEFRTLFASMSKPVLFFAGFSFGASVDLKAVVQSGFSGLILSLIYIVLITGLFYMVDRFILHEPGFVSISLCSVSPASVSMPAIIAQALPQYEADVVSAAAQIATAAVITVIVSVFMTKKVLSHRS